MPDSDTESSQNKKKGHLSTYLLVATVLLGGYLYFADNDPDDLMPEIPQEVEAVSNDTLRAEAEEAYMLDIILRETDEFQKVYIEGVVEDEGNPEQDRNRFSVFSSAGLHSSTVGGEGLLFVENNTEDVTVSSGDDVLIYGVLVYESTERENSFTTDDGHLPIIYGNIIEIN